MINLDRFGKRRAYPVEQIAECRFAVGIAHRSVKADFGLETGQLAVMGEAPVAPPQLADKGMGVGQADLADIGLADVADDHFALDRVALHQVGNFRFAAGCRVLKYTQPTSFVETDPPAIAMRAGAATTLHQPGKAENDIGRHVGAHAQ
ncbi:hypothetical protein D9M71_293730 [compost metagenome]